VQVCSIFGLSTFPLSLLHRPSDCERNERR
jgi:hypothetical protein